MRDNKYPVIGDYVICYEENMNDELSKFLSENIGIIFLNFSDTCSEEIKYRDDSLVKYFNVPESIKYCFNYIDSSSSSRIMSRKEIIYFSKNKEDLEIILTANKYNL